MNDLTTDFVADFDMNQIRSSFFKERRFFLQVFVHNYFQDPNPFNNLV